MTVNILSASSLQEPKALQDREPEACCQWVPLNPFIAKDVPLVQFSSRNNTRDVSQIKLNRNVHFKN